MCMVHVEEAVTKAERRGVDSHGVLRLFKVHPCCHCSATYLDCTDVSHTNVGRIVFSSLVAVETLFLRS